MSRLERLASIGARTARSSPFVGADARNEAVEYRVDAGEVAMLSGHPHGSAEADGDLSAVKPMSAGDSTTCSSPISAPSVRSCGVVDDLPAA